MIKHQIDAMRTSKHMSARRRFLLLTLIMVGACAMVMAVITIILYRHEINQQREMLQVTAKSQARLIEAVARFDAKTFSTIKNANQDYDASLSTLSQIIDAHERYEGFGKTGEFTLARRDGESIIFVLRHRHGAVERPLPVDFDSDLAEPMRMALQGLSGTIIGLDYRGETVLAAHEPVAVLNLGIVAKIDLTEIHAPFIRSSLTAAAIALFIVLVGTALFFWISNPMIKRLETHSRNLEKEIKERAQLSAQLKTKNKELEQIIYVTSHDLRSPLVNIDGYSKELEYSIDDLRREFDKTQIPTETLAPILDHDMPDALRFIRSSASKMDTLLTGLLKLSRSGRAALTIDLIDMNDLISKVVEASEFQIKKASVELSISELPPCKGDAVQVNQVFSNLLGNALQYLDAERPGAIRISGRIENEHSVYCVEDNGIGIAQTHQNNIFEIFHRLNPAKGEGEGLGLTIVTQILSRLSGNIWVESIPNEGSRFFVALPTEMNKK